MKIVASTIVVLLGLAPATVAWDPPRISYADLKDAGSDHGLLEALSSTGMVAITDVFPSSSSKTALMVSLVDCLQEDHGVSSFSGSSTMLPDGTQRHTLATHTSPGASKTNKHHDMKEDPSSCAQMQRLANDFRETVADVTGQLAKALDRAGQDGKTAFSLPKTSDETYHSMEDIVSGGDHLEHFHVYYPPNDKTETTIKTLDWHIDQGVALIFSPGLLVPPSHNGGHTTNLSPTGGFFVKLADGSEDECEFGPHDDLVLMLGEAARHLSPSLRPMPHALDLSSVWASSNQAMIPRAWYGRMVLPPMDAIAMEDEDGVATTFGDARLQAATRHLQTTDALEADCIEADQFYCWHRCFNYTDELNDEQCATDGLQLACANNDRLLWDETTHDPDFVPRCLNVAASNVYNASAVKDDATTHDSGADDHDHDHGSTGMMTSGAIATQWMMWSYTVAGLLGVVACIS